MSTRMSRVLVHSISWLELDHRSHKPSGLSVQRPEECELCDHWTSSHNFNFRRSSPPSMASSVWFWVWFIALVLLTTSNCVQTVKAQAAAPLADSLGDGFTKLITPPAMFVFGDSLVDPGNNNYIPSLAKANIPYNGIDFPGGPTGRFCNGRTVVDILCDILGVPYPPAFLNPHTNGSKVLHGVNYASGAGGILDATGANFLSRICMNQQIAYFQERTLSQLQAQLGTDRTSALLASSLVAIVIGSNDFINNYLLSDTDTQSQYTPAQFNILLVTLFSDQLKELYNSGFRMFFIAGIGPIGCIPRELAIFGQPNCLSSVNAQAQEFNALARSLLQNLNTALSGAMFLFGNVFDSMTEVINNPSTYGFTVVNQACCGGGLYRGQIQCQPAATVCINRHTYVFWDPYHPTEASNLILANGIYSGGTNAVTPINIQQLLAQQLQPYSTWETVDHP